MSKLSDKKDRKKFLWLSIVSNFSVLFFFKYFNFLNDSIKEVFSFMSISIEIPTLEILLPVGISFYTFQAVSYSIDVYRGSMKAETNLGHFALYISFFPQLVAGPIERPSNLLPQFKKEKKFNYQLAASGLRLMAWGFFKKLVIADNIAVIVNSIYAQHDSVSGGWLLIGAFLFTIQIYCDFSGYTDIAIGAARVMGFDFMKNFNRPFFSKSITEFWSRWHISLSTWFRDYLYIPLGGNRTVKWRWYYNLFITFLISGLWHGANWTFVTWGAIHGLTIVIERFFNVQISKNRFIRYFQILVTFTILVLTFHVFRSETIENSLNGFHRLFSDLLSFKLSTFLNFDSIQLNIIKVDWVIIAFGILLLFTIEFIQRKHKIGTLIYKLSTWKRWIIYCVFLITILLLGKFEGPQEFIYFQF
tara:strand:+ start:18463 stop:19713 length:1251 start_codon:yes stop_codon:yes gene_type:complete